MSYRRVPYSVRRYVQATLDKQVEDKQMGWELPTTFASITSTWTEANVSAPVPGTGVDQRAGATIRIKSLEIDGVLAGGQSQNALDDPFNVVRIVIYTAYAPPTATPLQTEGIGLNSVINIRGFNNLAKKYLDQYIAIPVTGTEKGEGDGYTPGLRTFKYYKRWKSGMPIVFDQGNVNDPSKVLIVAMISDSAAAPSPGFVAGYMKMCFEDA